jgi:hypothetical protein
MLESVGPLFALSTERGFPEWIAWAHFYQGQARAALGDLDQGIGEMIEGLSGFRSTGAQLAGSWLCGELAWACARAGRRDQAERFHRRITALEKTIDGGLFISVAAQGI